METEILVEVLQSVTFAAVAGVSYLKWKERRQKEYKWSTLVFIAAFLLNILANIVTFASFSHEIMYFVHLSFLTAWGTLFLLVALIVFRVIKNNKIF